MRLTWRNIDSKLSCCPNLPRGQFCQRKSSENAALFLLPTHTLPHPFKQQLAIFEGTPTWHDWIPSARLQDLGGQVVGHAVKKPFSAHRKTIPNGEIHPKLTDTQTAPNRSQLSAKNCKDGSALKNGQKEHQLSHFPDVLTLSKPQTRKSNKIQGSLELLPNKNQHIC